jgi:hypothetical protein
LNYDEIEKVALEELQSHPQQEDDLAKLHKAIASAIAEAFEAHDGQRHYYEFYYGADIVGPA